MGDRSDLGVFGALVETDEMVSASLDLSLLRTSSERLLDDAVVLVLEEPKASDEPPREEVLLPHRLRAMSVPKRDARLLKRVLLDDGVVLPGRGTRTLNMSHPLTES